MKSAPLPWVKEITRALDDAKQIPLHGYVPAFPWETLSAEIAALFNITHCKIHPRNTQFLTSEELTSGFGSGAVPCVIELTPLVGKAYFLIGREEMAKLTTLLLFPLEPQRGLSSQQFQEGFYYFLLNKAILALNNIHAFESLSVKMGAFEPLPEENALCIDVEFSIANTVIWARVICPDSFHQAFKTHFSTPSFSFLTHEHGKNLDLTLKVVVGKTALTLSQYKTLDVGDFLILDRCSFDPDTQKGTATLHLDDHPLLRARIKENSLKITDYAFYNEEDKQMPYDMPEEENKETPHFEEEQQSEEENAEHLWATEKTDTPLAEGLIPTAEIPLVLTVEVDRLKMKLDQLLQLAPGNVLELSVRPEQGVALTIGGKKVAHAELIKLGDVLGVKILHIGD